MIFDCTLDWGGNTTMDKVRIQWPNGSMEVLRGIPADFIYTVPQGKGIQQKLALSATTASKTYKSQQ